MISASDHALVIGIEDYFVIPKVPFAKQDARAFADVLHHTRGVPAENIRALDHFVNREKIVEAARQIGEQAGVDAVVWIYYAGHGAGSPTDGNRLLLGSDVQPDPVTFAARSVGVDEL